jgi:nucleoid DNA-binding protein
LQRSNYQSRKTTKNAFKGSDYPDQFVREIADELDIDRRLVGYAVYRFFDKIIDAACEGKVIHLYRIGTFEVKRTRYTQKKYLSTKDAINFKYRLIFKPSSQLSRYITSAYMPYGGRKE